MARAQLIDKWKASGRRRFNRWVLRRQGADTIPFAIQRRRIYILPTRAGYGFAVLAITMLVAGLNYTNSLALFLTFLLSGFALVTMHRTHRNLLELRVTDAGTTATFAGEKGLLTLLISNESAIPRYGIETRAPDKTHAVADVLSRATARYQLYIPTHQRGRLRLDRLQISTTHPFGLFRAWTWIHLPLAITVYPRPHGSQPMPDEPGIKPGSRVRAGGGEDEWLGLRPFRDGDSPRQVAWKAYARGAPLLVKEYGASGSERRLFDFAQLVGLDTEARLEQLARWIVDAETAGESYGLTLGDQHYSADHGIEHRHQCLTALAWYALPREEAGHAAPSDT